MRIVRLSLLVIAAVFLSAGCNKQEVDTTPTNVTEIDGLAVSLNIPSRLLTMRERFVLTVTAHNRTRQPMQIEAETGAPVYVRIFRHTGLVWEEIKRYPTSTTMIMSFWTLQPGAKRSFMMDMTVEPDWPVGEPLRITVELNGRAEVSPGVVVEVNPLPESQGQ